MIDNKYVVLQDIGEGTFATYIVFGLRYRVKLVQAQDGTYWAAKVYKSGADWQNEWQVLRELDSPSILKVIDCNPNGILTSTLSPGQEKMLNPDAERACKALEGRRFAYIIMEWAENGELFSYLEINGPTSEKIARYYFCDIIAVIEHLHQRGIAHRDIKLSNLLLSRDFHILLADFGVASRPHSEAILQGTIKYTFDTYYCSYLAPETWAIGGEICAYKADIYAAGVVLFNLVSGYMPYDQASPNDPLFELFKQSPEQFWQHHERHTFEATVPHALKELLTGMLAPSPAERWSLRQIQTSVWFQGSCAEPSDVLKEMRKRRSSVDFVRAHPEKKNEIIKANTERIKARKQQRHKPPSRLNYVSLGPLLWNFLAAVL